MALYDWREVFVTMDIWCQFFIQEIMLDSKWWPLQHYDTTEPSLYYDLLLIELNWLREVFCG